MICVDELRAYPNRPHGFDRWAHLFDDHDDRDALHAFAAKIGLRRAWFQAHLTLPHYDVTAGKHAAALRAGAHLVTWEEHKEILRRRFEERQAQHEAG